MHSSGRGEESPEAYRGVVLPAAQHQPPVPYGDQVQPAGGSPWGAPATPPAPAAPAPADATQMLPPYPAAPAPGAPHAPGPGTGPGPLPVADATQMLPPYPGGAPAAPQPAAGPGPVPPLPPVPPQPPQQAPAAQAQQAAQDYAQQQFPPVKPLLPQTGQVPGGRGDEPAEATQALPLSIFHEQEYEPGYDQRQPYGQDYPQQQYGQEHGGYEQAQGPAPAPQHDSDYDHLFRNDVPGPAPLRQRIIQPPSQQQVGQQPGPQAYAAQGAGRPPYGQQGYDPAHDPAYGYEGEDGGGKRRMSPKVLIGIVVAGCVVAGLVVGGLLNSGGKASADNAGGTSPTPSASATASADGNGGTADSPAAQQAKALDSLLKTSGASRSSVVAAVESIKNCGNLAGAASDLRSASGQRVGLVTQLGALSVDQLPHHADLTDALTKAWRASAAADSHYANWAGEAEHNHKVCKGGHARATAEAQAGNRESGTATQQKKRAVRLWNAIAKQYGLTQRQFSQL